MGLGAYPSVAILITLWKPIMLQRNARAAVTGETTR